ncbi:MAG: hypothetical protein JO199_05480 [Candidatus Eremiobacteraeota bacterium]|nr:hypothetical protein [Candidatus Eremiobacteraeota bacterium]
MSGVLGKNRGVTAIASLVALLTALWPAMVLASAGESDQQQEALALTLFDHQTCAIRHAEAIAQVTPDESPSPSPVPSPVTTPGLPGTAPGAANGTRQFFTPPKPQPGVSPTTSPPPIPTPTPAPTGSNPPIFLERGGETPPPIPPAGQATPSPSPEPTGVPTLAPGFVAVIADEVAGGTKRGQPGDATGNVHIYYSVEEIVGERAHFDGNRTITITGHPFIINHEKDSVLTADAITFDTIAETAKLSKGQGESTEGLVNGYVHFGATDLHTDPDGSAHGLNPTVTTCENARSGYHITGKSIDVIPGDKIVINKAVLWLGAAAVFYLPQLVIPLRTVSDQRAKPQFFPEVGYDSYEGAWIKTHLSFGKDQYYYGYYIVNYFTKLGLGLGYVAFYGSHKGRRQVSINFYEQQQPEGGGRGYNAAIQEQENFSQHLRGNFQFGYQSSYGALTNVPPNETLTGAIVHQTAQTSQNYSFNHSGIGSQSSSNTFTFTDTRQFNQYLNQAVSLNVSETSADFGGSTTTTNASGQTVQQSAASTTNQTEFDYLMHYTTTGADYQMEYNKTYTQQGYGINKIPEFQVRPYDFFQHFVFPMSAQLTFGEYSQPAGTGEPQSLATWRGDAGLIFGPAQAKVFGSDLQATINVDQYAYGTGDLKAAIQQIFALTTPIGSHIVNSITYNEANYNGPALVPFQALDQQPLMNTSNAQDLIRFFNDDVYTLSLGWATNFPLNANAQPVSYQLQWRPSPRSVVLLAGSYIPGPGLGFETTNLQLSTPFGRDASIQFISDINWHSQPGSVSNEFLANKVIYYTRTIGNCYQVQVLYAEASKSVNVGLSLLAFPNRTASFVVGQPGTILPSTFNF